MHNSLTRYNKHSNVTALFSNKGLQMMEALQARATGTADKRTAKYRSVDTVDLVEALLHHVPTLDRDTVSITTRGSKASSTNHVVRIPTANTLLVGGTLVQPELILRNSFAGESTLIMNLGFFRQVCSNGLMVGESLIPSVTLKHIEGPKFETGLDDFFFNTVHLLQSDIVSMLESKVLMGKIVNDRMALTIIETLPVSVAVKKTAESWIVHKYVRREDTTDGGFTAWNVWNIVNEAARQRARDPQGPALVERESKLMDSVVEQFKKAA